MKTGPRDQTARVKALLAEGLCNKEIMERLHRGKSVISRYLAKLYKQAGLYGRADERRFMIWIITGQIPGG